MNTLFLLFGFIFFITLNGATSLPKYEQKFTLRGRVILPNGPRIPIESDGKLTVELQDTSLADAPAKVIAQGNGKAIRFPMAFAIKYTSKQIIEGMSYSLRVSIKNKNDELLYTNDMHIKVTPLGPDRTKFINVPVKLVKKSTPKPSTGQWFHLVGTKGEEAVKIIKQETGFKNVMTVKAGSPVTMDFRTDRVRVFVNDRGVVTQVPIIA